MLETTSMDIEVTWVWYVESWTEELALQMVAYGYMLITGQEELEMNCIRDEAKKRMISFY